MKTVKFLLLIIITLFFILVPFSFSQESKIYNILILNSYSSDYIWSENILKGINETLKTNNINSNLRIEYMDTKYNNSKEYYNLLFSLYKNKYKNVKFDAIISSDDNAFRFLLKNRESLFKNVPIFFCGLNSINSYDLKNEQNIYGLEEKFSLPNTLDIAFKSNSNINKIYLITDNTVSGNSTKYEFKRQAIKYNPNLKILFIKNNTIETLKNEVSIITDKNSIIIFAYYITDDFGNKYSISKSTKEITSIAKIPIYGLFSFNLSNGIIGGNLISGYSQGKRATEIMISYFKEDFVGKTQYLERDVISQNMFDYNMLIKYHINLNTLPKDSLIINKPNSFYEKNKKILIVGTSIIIFLILYIITLRFQINKKTKANIKIEKELLEHKRMNSLGILTVGISHEINTPLGNSITIATYLDKIADELKESYISKSLKKSDLLNTITLIKNSVNILVTNLNKISILVNSFKNIMVNSNINASKKFNIRQLIEETTYLFSEEISKYSHKVNIECNKNLIVIGERNHYKKIFENLISNSLQHGFKNSTNGIINISVFFENNELSIKYSDNGCGFESKENAFEPFYTTNRGSNVGLGLYSVYNIVNLLNGIITLDNNSIGTKFNITIPLTHNN
ncbi:sensor histidine kinase [Helicovermis profundi]|uniref:histidine kinase n=1 Tax=Helicovermis profundi TaxID=3065157 RepID=A0AAU9EDT3_9FIRM|nr:hypothetical protein HLPR_19000 [Clostridia bacterium S502]